MSPLMFMNLLHLASSYISLSSSLDDTLAVILRFVESRSFLQCCASCHVSQGCSGAAFRAGVCRLVTGTLTTDDFVTSHGGEEDFRVMLFNTGRGQNKMILGDMQAGKHTKLRYPWLQQVNMEYPLYKETWRGTPCEVIIIKDQRHLRQLRCEWCDDLQNTLIDLSEEAGELEDQITQQALKDSDLATKPKAKGEIMGKWEGAEYKLHQRKSLKSSQAKSTRPFDRLLSKNKPADLVAKFNHYKERYSAHIEDYVHTKSILQIVQKPLRNAGYHRVPLSTGSSPVAKEDGRWASVESLYDQHKHDDMYSMLTPMSLLDGEEGDEEESYSYRALDIAARKFPLPHISQQLILSYKPETRQGKRGHLCKPGKLAQSKRDRTHKDKADSESGLSLPKLTITERMRHGHGMGKCELYWINSNVK